MQDHTQINIYIYIYIYTPLPVSRVFGARSGSLRITHCIIILFPDSYTIKCIVLAVAETDSHHCLVNGRMNGISQCGYSKKIPKLKFQ